jgi:hypothetical protein
MALMADWRRADEDQTRLWQAWAKSSFSLRKP